MNHKETETQDVCCFLPEAMTVAVHSPSINDYLARKRRYKKTKACKRSFNDHYLTRKNRFDQQSCVNV